MADPLAILFLVSLSHRRWTLPILAHMQLKGGARAIELVQKLKLNRETLAETLDWVRDHGWVAKNEGYGHALRPEYCFTDRGARMGRPAAELMEAVSALNLEDPLLRKWALALVYLIGLAPARFATLKAALPGITPRALTQALKALIESGVIERIVEDDYPPQVRYVTARRGRMLLPRLKSLVEAGV